jgi:hypothetical protein
LGKQKAQRKAQTSNMRQKPTVSKPIIKNTTQNYQLKGRYQENVSQAAQTILRIFKAMIAFGNPKPKGQTSEKLFKTKEFVYQAGIVDDESIDLYERVCPYSQYQSSKHILSIAIDIDKFHYSKCNEPLGCIINSCGCCRHHWNGTKCTNCQDISAHVLNSFCKQIRSNHREFATLSQEVTLYINLVYI